MNRRTFVKAAGSIGAASALGVGASVLASNPVSAGGSHNIGNVKLASDDGTIDYVSIYGDGRLDWEGFDEPATQVQVRNIVTVLEDGEQLERHQVNDTGKRDLDGDLMGDGEKTSGSGTRGTVISDIGQKANGEHDPTTDWHIIGYDPDEYGLPQDPLPADVLTVEDDGETVWYEVEFETIYTLYAEDGSELGSASSTSVLDVGVENIASDAVISNEDGEDGGMGGTSNDSSKLD